MNNHTIDQSAIQRLRATLGSEASVLLPELIDEFREEAEVLLGLARQALADSNAVDLRRAAHTLKSNGATFGAMNVAAISQELEDLAKQERIQDGAGLIEILESELEVAQLALNELRGTL